MQFVYVCDLKDFLEWFDEKGIVFDVVSCDVIEVYLVYCDVQGLVKFICVWWLLVIKQFYCFVFEEGWMDINFVIQIRGSGCDKCLFKMFEVIEVDCLIEVVQVLGCNFLENVRNICLMQLFYVMGMWVSEFVLLFVSVVWGDLCMFLIFGKGGKECMVFLLGDVCVVLVVWLIECDSDEEKKYEKGLFVFKFLFLSCGKFGYIMWYWFYVLIKEFVVVGGFSLDKVMLYMFCYVFVMYFLVNGVDLWFIQVFLGYVDVVMMEIYIYVLDEWLKELVLDYYLLVKD